MIGKAKAWNSIEKISTVMERRGDEPTRIEMHREAKAWNSYELKGKEVQGISKGMAQKRKATTSKGTIKFIFHFRKDLKE